MISEPFPLIHHSTMLADSERLTLYKKAMAELINSDSIVVDIGTGTGILAHYAALQGASKVFGIEYFTSSYNVACEIAKTSTKNTIQFLNGRSYDINLDCSPNILVTETIGPIGPEENIVEICYDFCSRHPSIEKIIPMSMSIYAQPFFSNILDQKYAKILENYNISDCNSFEINSTLKEKFEILYSTILFQGYLSDAISVGPEIPIISYNFGLDKHSSFEAQFKLSKYKKFNGIYLYFEVNLTNKIKLINHFTKTKLHWVPFYFRKPRLLNEATISYSSKTKKVTINWN